ncbi:hypothetical protein HK102_000202 [Quaeritorhiza haematococci]|nr:hypothetical protein HK102_000202 [Quaeritorhiza haematococci]
MSNQPQSTAITRAPTATALLLPDSIWQKILANTDDPRSIVRVSKRLRAVGKMDAVRFAWLCRRPEVVLKWCTQGDAAKDAFPNSIITEGVLNLLATNIFTGITFPHLSTSTHPSLLNYVPIASNIDLLTRKLWTTSCQKNHTHLLCKLIQHNNGNGDLVEFLPASSWSKAVQVAVASKDDKDNELLRLIFKCCPADISEGIFKGVLIGAADSGDIGTLTILMREGGCAMGHEMNETVLMDHAADRGKWHVVENILRIRLRFLEAQASLEAMFPSPEDHKVAKEFCEGKGDLIAVHKALRQMREEIPKEGTKDSEMNVQSLGWKALRSLGTSPIVLQILWELAMVTACESGTGALEVIQYLVNQTSDSKAFDDHERPGDNNPTFVVTARMLSVALPRHPNIATFLVKEVKRRAHYMNQCMFLPSLSIPDFYGEMITKDPEQCFQIMLRRYISISITSLMNQMGFVHNGRDINVETANSICEQHRRHAIKFFLYSGLIDSQTETAQDAVWALCGNNRTHHTEAQGPSEDGVIQLGWMEPSLPVQQRAGKKSRSAKARLTATATASDSDSDEETRLERNLPPSALAVLSGLGACSKKSKHRPSSNPSVTGSSSALEEDQRRLRQRHPDLRNNVSSAATTPTKGSPVIKPRIIVQPEEGVWTDILQGNLREGTRLGKSRTGSEMFPCWMESTRSHSWDWDDGLGATIYGVKSEGQEVKKTEESNDMTMLVGFGGVAAL